MPKLVYRTLVACTLGISSLSLLAQECPPFSYGLSEVTIDNEMSFMSVARSRMTGNDDAGQQMAESIAEMKAKAKLQSRDPSGGPLIGAIKQFVCTKDQFVYVGFRQSEKDRKSAAAVQDAVNQSIKRQPTPTQ